MGCLSQNRPPAYPPAKGAIPPGSLNGSLEASFSILLSSAHIIRVLRDVWPQSVHMHKGVCHPAPLIQRSMRNKKGQWPGQSHAPDSEAWLKDLMHQEQSQTLPRKQALADIAASEHRPLQESSPSVFTITTTNNDINQVVHVSHHYSQLSRKLLLPPSPTTFQKVKSFPEGKRMQPTFFQVPTMCREPG